MKTQPYLLALFLLVARNTMADPAPTLQVDVNRDTQEVTLSWKRTTVTAPPKTPLYFSYQLQESDDLGETDPWENVGPSFVGGLGGAAGQPSHKLPLTETTRYYRLVYGVDLSSQDLSNRDLREFDFSNANLDGADFSGSDLTGANFVGAQLEGTIFTGADLTGAEFGPSSDLYHLTEFGGDPTLAAGTLPALPVYAHEDDFVRTVPGCEDIRTSQKTLVVVMTATATVGDVNELLHEHKGRVIGLIGADLGLAEPLIGIRFPGDASEIAALRSALDTSPSTVAVMYDLGTEERIQPSYEGRMTLPDWRWNADTAGDWNWGLKFAGVPALWNWNDGIERLAGLRNLDGTTAPPVVVIDSGFQLTHPELARATTLGTITKTGKAGRHGTHVAGIVSGEFSKHRPNPKPTEGGTEGVDPFCNLHLMQKGSGTLAQLRDITWVAKKHDARVINCSYGLSWTLAVVGGTPVVVQPPSRPDLQGVIALWASRVSVMLSQLSEMGKLPLIVVASGNDGVDSQWAGPLERYARTIGTHDIIVVGSQQRNSSLRANSSNFNVDLLAPGKGIGSSVPLNSYEDLSGTSMAAPHVTGLASFLLHFNPNLTNSQLKTLLTNGTIVPPAPGGSPSALDAYSSAFLVDEVAPPAEMTVLQMLLDVDDGTPDGNLRQRYFAPEGFDPEAPPVAQTYEKEWTNQLSDPGGISHPEETILDRPGDGHIDMSDFRKWRDHLLYAEMSVPSAGALNLDGDNKNSKLDANHNGKVETFGLERRHPRTDFNGDGIISRRQRSSITAKTDLEILTESGLWADPWVNLVELPDLIDSGDLRVVLTETVFEFTETFSSIQIVISGGGRTFSREFDATTDGRAIDATLFWNYHNRNLLFTLPVGTHDVRINFRRGRNATVASFEGSADIQLGEDDFYTMKQDDHVSDE